MVTVVDREQRLSEGHSEAEDRKLDLQDLTDDEEVPTSEGCRGAGPTGGRGPRSARGRRFRGTGDSAGGMALDVGSAWGSTKMEPSGTANPSD